jgi:NAD kinase
MFEKVMIVSKKTELEYFEDEYGNAMDAVLHIKGIRRSILEDKHAYHTESLENVVKCFSSEGIRPRVIRKQSLSATDFSIGWDLIVSVGGDGTFMDVARYIRDKTLLFGVKSSPHSIGGHYNTNFSTAKDHIGKILAGNFIIEERQRIHGSVKGQYKIKDLALNDVFIHDLYSPGYSWLRLHYRGQEYDVGGSGIVISTYRGRTGWYENIPMLDYTCYPVVELSDAKFEHGDAEILRYKVRESNTKENTPARYGYLRSDEAITITYLSKSKGCCSFDGSKPDHQRHRCYPLDLGQSVRLSLSDKHLSVVRVE